MSDDRRELLLGCGTNWAKKVTLTGHEHWVNRIALDRCEAYKPDVLFDLASEAALPFEADFFDEIHAYEVLEHLGRQGDWPTMARQFADYWRVLKPNGHLIGTVPCWKSLWAFGDPDHKRIINEGTLTFFRQTARTDGSGMTPMAECPFEGDFDTATCFHSVKENEPHDRCNVVFILRAVKPARA